MATTYKKRIPDNVLISFDSTPPAFYKVATNPDSAVKAMHLFTGTLAETNILTLAAQMNAQPAMFEDSDATAWDARKTTLLIALENSF